MHTLMHTCRILFTLGMSCLFGGQLLWFVAGGTYNALCCLARGQSPLAWLRQISFVHLHALLPPVRSRGRIPPHVLRRRYPLAPWWYRAAGLGMGIEMLGLFITLAAVICEAFIRLSQPTPMHFHLYNLGGGLLIAALAQIWSLA